MVDGSKRARRNGRRGVVRLRWYAWRRCCRNSRRTFGGELLPVSVFRGIFGEG